MRLTKPQRDALPDSDFAGPGKSFPIPDKGHAHAALGLINNAPPAARSHIRERAEAMLHSDHRAKGGMVADEGLPEIDDSDADDPSYGTGLEQAMLTHTYHQGQAAAAIPHAKRRPEHYAAIQHYHQTFGIDQKAEPEMHKAQTHLERLLAQVKGGKQPKAAPAAPAPAPAAPAYARKDGGMVGYKDGGKIGDSARKAAAILLLIHPGMGRAARARR